jgi:multicomponent Na+:H+ antiporter subunit D
MSAPAPLPPALVLFGGAALLPLVPRALRPVLAVAVPAVALWYVATLVPDATATLPFLGYTLEVVRVDRLSRLFGLVFCLVGVLGGLYAWRVADTREQTAALVYTGGALGVTFAGDLLTLYACWETMALAAAVLVWAGGTPAAERAGTRYLLVHLSGGAVLLAGILLHAGAGGTIAFRAFDAGAPSLAAWLVLAAFCLNAAAPPLGAWLPDAYPQATVTGSVFLSALTTKTAVYVLLRAFAGWDLLVPLGVAMALYGAVWAVLANDVRAVLSYSIVSQVGYMVAGVGLGTETATNGAAAHAVCHILYKSLLFMTAGVVVHTTGRGRLTELGGLLDRQRLVFLLYVVGGASIAGVPPWSGFVSKSMIVAAAGEAHRWAAVLLLTLASVGSLVHTGLRLPYFVWVGEDRGLRPAAAPRTMVAAAALAALLSTLLGVAPTLLYGLLPHPVDYRPWTADHVLETAQLLLFAFLAFAMLLPALRPRATLTLDTDVVYRAPARALRALTVRGVDVAFERVEALELGVARRLVQALRDPTAWVGGRMAPDAPFDPDRARSPLLVPLTLAVVTFVALAVSILASAR